MSYETWKFLEGQTPEGLVVVLRPLHMDDADCIGKWRNTEELRQLLNVDYPVTLEAVQDWLRSAISQRGNPVHIPVAVCVEGKLIGTAGIHEISLRHRHGKLGIYIGDQEFRGKRIGTVVYELLLKYAFRELDLRVICAHVYGHNEPSKKLHSKMGFQQVGCIPKWQSRDQDELTYCISKEEWIALQK